MLYHQITPNQKAGTQIDTLEAQLLAILGQLQTLITAAGGGAGRGADGGGGAGGCVAIPVKPKRRRLHVSNRVFPLL